MFLGLLLADLTWRLDDVSFPGNEERHLAHFRVCGPGKQEKPPLSVVVEGSTHTLLPSTSQSGSLGCREGQHRAFHHLCGRRETKQCVTAVTTHHTFPWGWCNRHSLGGHTSTWNMLLVWEVTSYSCSHVKVCTEAAHWFRRSGALLLTSYWAICWAVCFNSVCTRSTVFLNTSERYWGEVEILV